MDTKKLRQKILDLAIHGRLVKQDPNDEPASVLLQRIREEKERLVHEGKIKRPKKAKAASDMMSHGNGVPFEVPQGWVWTTVNDISASILYGVSESAKSIGKYKLLRITDIQNNKVEWDKVPFTDFDEIKAEAYLLKDGDILFARTGATVGKSYLVKGISEQSIYASYLIRVQIVDAILPDYVKFFFESGFYWEQIERNSVGIGQPNVNGTVLGNLPIPLPPLPEQHRIVKEVERWFALIDKIEQGKADLQAAVKQAKAKILDLAIHGKLVPQNPSDEPASELLRRINPAAACENGACGKLPSGWAVTTIKDSFLLLSGQDFPPEKYNDREEGIPYITGASNIVQGKLIINRWTTSPSVKSYCDDILVVCKGSVGEMTLNDVGEIHIARQIQAIRDIHHIVKIEYLKAVVSYNITDIVSKANGLIPGLRRDLLLSLSIPLPPLPEQHRIVAKIEELFAQLDSIQSSLITAV